MPMTQDKGQEERLDRFLARIDPAMMVLALLWLQVLVVPLATTLHGGVALAFDVIDYAIWAAFAAEYVMKFRLAINHAHLFGRAVSRGVSK